MHKKHKRSKKGKNGKNSKWLVCKQFATDNRKFALFSKCAYSTSLFMCLWCAPVRDTSCIIALVHLIADDFHFLFHVKFVCVLMAKASLAAHNLLFQFCFPHFIFANFPFAHLFYIFVWLSACSLFFSCLPRQKESQELANICQFVERQEVRTLK